MEQRTRVGLAWGGVAAFAALCAFAAIPKRQARKSSPWDWTDMRELPYRDLDDIAAELRGFDAALDLEAAFLPRLAAVVRQEYETGTDDEFTHDLDLIASGDLPVSDMREIRKQLRAARDPRAKLLPSSQALKKYQRRMLARRKKRTG